MSEKKNRRLDGVEVFHSRLENAARRLLANADEAKELFLVAPLDMIALRNVLAAKPTCADTASRAQVEELIGVTRAVVFDGLEDAIPDQRRALSLVQAVKELIAIEINHALSSQAVQS